MKNNIERTDYYGNVDHHGNWWHWDETCDRCGKVIKGHDAMSMSCPDTEEADFCVECLRYLMDNKIQYQDALKQYKKSL